MLNKIIEKIKNEYYAINYAGNNFPTKGGRSQRDNNLFPSGSCNFTASANCLDYLDIDITPEMRKRFFKYTQKEDILSAFSESPEAKKEFKKYYPQFTEQSEIRPRHFSEMVAWVTNRCVGFEVAKWGLRTYDEIVKLVKEKVPVVVSGKFTAFGHFIAIKGITPDENYFWVDDSWGDYYTNYRSHNGHNLLYSVEIVRDLCWGDKKKHRTIIYERKNEN